LTGLSIKGLLSQKINLPKILNIGTIIMEFSLK